jgi:hypothetical protein
MAAIFFGSNAATRVVWSSFDVDDTPRTSGCGADCAASAAPRGDPRRSGGVGTPSRRRKKRRRRRDDGRSPVEDATRAIRPRARERFERTADAHCARGPRMDDSRDRGGNKTTNDDATCMDG